jgi:putative zinc finger/helix-turn-helix YgiT family protein
VVKPADDLAVVRRLAADGWSSRRSRRTIAIPELCAECGNATLTERTVPFEFHHGGKSATIEDVQTSCATCGNVSYIGTQISRHELAVAAKIREMDGLLSADELRRVRTKYAFRQTDLEAMLSVGPKTWTRWERGKVPQSKAADTLIRVLAEDPEVARRLMEQSGVDNPAAAAVFASIDEDTRRFAADSLRAEIGDGLKGIDVGRVAARAVDVVREARQGRGVKAA